MIGYLQRGVLAGLAGGAAMAAFLLLVGEHSIREALAIEAARETGEPSVEMFSRSTQLAGGAAAALIYGVLAGVIFGVVFAAVRHRSRAHDDFIRAIGLAATAFGTLVLVPALKYPANPPAVGDPATVGARTVAYLTLVAASIVVSLAAWRAARWLRVQGFEDHLRLPLVGAGYVAVIGAAYALWPPNPDTIEVPASLIWRFRLASLGGAAALWSVVGVTFGWMSLRASSARRPSASPAPLTRS